MKVALHDWMSRSSFTYAGVMARSQERWGTPLTDPTVLRALSHPARLRMLDVLAARGGATATQCAEVVDLSASACSWHLRQLAAAGLVADAGPGSDGRQRVWQATLPSWQTHPEDIDAEPEEAQGLDLALTQAMLVASDAAVEAHTVRAAQGQEPQEWRQAATVSNSTLRISAPELEDLVVAVMALLDPYRLTQRPAEHPDQRVVAAALRFVPATPHLDVEQAPEGERAPADDAG